MFWHIFEEGDDAPAELEKMQNFLRRHHFTVSSTLASQLARMAKCADPILSIYALDRLPSDTCWGAQHYNTSSSFQLYKDMTDAPVVVWICGIVCDVHLCDRWSGSPVHNASININPVIPGASSKAKKFLREHSNPTVDSLLNGWDNIRVSKWTSEVATFPPIPNAFLNIFDGRSQMTDPSRMRHLIPTHIDIGDLVLVQANIIRFRPRTVSFGVSAGTIVNGPMRLPKHRVLDYSRPPYIRDIGDQTAASYWDSWVSMLELDKIFLLRKEGQ